MIESSLGIVGACLPMLRPVFARKTTHGGKGHIQSPEEEGSVVNDMADE